MLSRLENLATEIIRGILGQLVELDWDSGRRDLDDIYNLRLTSRTIGAVADAIFIQEIVFCLCSKRDVDMVRALANHPVYRNYPSTLALTFDMMPRDRISSLEYTTAIRRENPKIDRIKSPKDKAIDQDYHLYLRFFDEQT